MRKQTKIAVVLSAAAMLAIGASMTSFAAKGWVNEGDAWYYYGNDGEPVTDKWKNYNGNYFYLGEDGAMLTNELIDDNGNYFYVDANGAMVKNTWVAIAADEDEEQDCDYRWYYFGPTGKAYRDTFKKNIGGKKYGFDDEGKMLFGFVSDSKQILNGVTEEPVIECSRYYGAADDGAMYTGWLKYDEYLDSKEGLGYEYYWFYFNNNGKVKDKAAKKINGKWYNFDADGVMLLELDGNDATNATEARFFSGDLENGSLQKSAWIWACTDAFDGDGESDHWYRTNSQGYLVADRVQRVNGKWYVFNTAGEMQYGLVILDANTKADAKIAYDLDDTGIEAGIVDEDVCTAAVIENLDSNKYFVYYFSNDEEHDGSMKTGKNIKIALAEDEYTFGFSKTSGAGLNGEVDKKIWKNGILKCAGSSKYIVVDDKVVNASGTIMKKGVYKNDDDQWLLVQSNGKYYDTYDYKTQKDAEENGSDTWALKDADWKK